MDRIAPRISIVVPSRNAAFTIGRTLESLSAQQYPNLQIISIDGDSTDSTTDIIKQHKDLIDISISEKDKNVADALNKGFKLANGEILGYLNADDTLQKAALSHVASLFQDNADVDVVTGGCLRVYEDGSQQQTFVPEDFLEKMALRNRIEQPSTFWRRAIYDELGQLDESFFLAFDWEWWNRMNSAGARFLRTDEILSTYYFSATNLTSNAGMRIINEMYRITKQYGHQYGKIADAYQFLFKHFDMKGYYDRPFKELPYLKRIYFGTVLKCLYLMYGHDNINAYNWNWASKQIRGITWYK